ncbi:hypothetical protein Q9L58_001904 [Maublancomyces gigas]|uniref:RING-type domain-containing protein n=1 Tax=Discina gigas TaxID=1032678 RepID=A0ABR3GT78_9PEZI
MTEPNEHHPLPEPNELSETELAIYNALALEGIDIPDAERRRWLERARRHADIAQEEWIAANGTSEQRQAMSTPSGLVAAVEQAGELQQTRGEASKIIGHWDGPAPDPEDLGRAADYAAHLLELFMRVKPADDAQIGTEHKELLVRVMSSLPGMTRRIQALELGTDGDGERQKSPSLIIPSGCAVCYSAVADMALMPCGHLALCEVCVVFAVGEQ